MPVSDPAVSRPRLIRDARFLEAGRREIALRQGSHTGETGTALLEAGADPNARDNDGKRPFVYAEDNEQLKGTDAYWKLNDARFTR